MAWKTRAGGAAMKISTTRAFWSGVMATVVMFLLSLLLGKFLEHLQHLGPASAVILAGNIFLGQAAVCDFYSSACGVCRKLPTHDGGAGLVVVPVGNPRINQKMRRIEFENLAMTLELAHAVD